MIWWFNPKRKTLFVPELKVSIPNVKSLDEARNFISTENLSDYNYIVKSRTGKLHPFVDFESANEFATNKSTKTVCYTVWHEGKPVVSYMNHKALPKWETVYRRNKERSWNPIPKKNDWYYSTPRGQYDTDSWDLATTIEVAEGKVRVSDIKVHFIKCPNGHFEKKFSRDSKVFNRDGSVYSCEDGKIRHISAHNMSLYLEDDALEILRKELSKLRPELTPVLKDVEYWNLIEAFSRPTYCYKFDSYKGTIEKRNNHIYFGYYPKEIVEESKLIDVLAKRVRVPLTKTLRKLYNQNIHNMNVVKFLKAMGFKDVNSYHKLVGFGVHFSRHNPERFSEFFKKLISVRGENSAVKLISDTDFDLMKDVAQSYGMVDEVSAEIVIRDARNFEEIHETFNVACPARGDGIDRKIVYSDKEKNKFNFVAKDGVRFELAEGSRDLALIGYSMGICVGGYAETALRKQDIIVKMLDGDKYAACIEVKKHGVVQIKAQFNNPVKSQYRSAIKEWLKHGDIKCTCPDYYAIGKPWHSNHNYAHIRPDDFTQEEHRPMLRIIKAEHVKYIHNNEWFAPEETDTSYEYNSRIFEDAVSATRPQEPVTVFTSTEVDELPF